MSSSDNDIVIGIDLGTTNSCVAVEKDGRFEVIANSQGERTTPSFVAFTEEGERLIGQAAKGQVTSNVKRTIMILNALWDVNSTMMAFKKKSLV